MDPIEFVQGSVTSPVRSLSSVSDPLQIFEHNLLTTAVVEFRSPAVGVAGNALSGLKRAVIFQKIRYAGRPERVR